MQAIAGLFGGGSSKRQAEEQKQENEKSRQLQTIANDRQLAEQNRRDTSVQTTRRAPRGRRLFEEDASSGSSAVLA